MKSQLFVTGVVIAMVVSLVAAPQSMAKPGDLPAQNGIECSEGGEGPVKGKFSIELDFTAKGLSLKIGAGLVKPTAAPTTIDTVMPAFFDQILSHVGDMLARPDRFISVDALLRMLPQARSGDAKADAKNRATVETRLFEPVNVKIKDVPLKQAIKNLAHVSGVRIVPDLGALNDACMDAPVSLAVENTSLYTALQQLLQSSKLAFEIENDVVIVTTRENCRSAKVGTVQRTKNETAQRFFEMAERHRRASDFDLARSLYQQVHLLAPTTLHGRVAIARIVEIEDRLRETSEEQDIPHRSADPEQVFRHIQNRTVPLGLVEVSY